ncbi:MAG: DUF4040 family protein [Actinomycetaceae bacterium]
MLLIILTATVLACLGALPLGRALGRSAGHLLALPLIAGAVLAATAWTESSGPVSTEVPWMPTLGVDLALRLDGLSLGFTIIVLVVGAVVLFYSARYLGGGGLGRFYLLMTAFAAAMTLLVLTDDLVVLYVAWELTTLCSFFLISRSGTHAHAPAIRTLLVTVLGGLSLLAAVVVMIVGAGTTRISEVLADPVWTSDGTFTTTVAVLVAVAAFTKSAQFPFQAWLPDSMVAITPVSTYLHAAAMVKAGIYLLLRFSPAFAGVPTWSVLLVGAGLVTALLGAAGALRRHDLKELLAYSTISQLGLLVAAIGVGTEEALTAAVVHTFAHALFKASLFMLVGVVDHEAGTRDLRELARMRVRMPVTLTAMTLAAASMAGVPLLMGFISKESLLTAFVGAPGPAWVAVVVTAAVAATSVLTFAYSGRLVLGAAGGRSGPEVAEARPAFLAAPVLGAATGLALGLVPSLADPLVSAGATGAVGTPVDAHLALWHGVTTPLLVSITILTLGTVLVLARRRVDAVVQPLGLPISGLDVVDRLRYGAIDLGGRVGAITRSLSPRQHLGFSALCLGVMALLMVVRSDGLPPLVGDPTRPLDWLLVALVAAGVLSAVRARTRISAVVVTGVVGFSITLWFFVLGAPDVAMTQLLVEILTVCVMVLLLRRLPRTMRTPSRRRRVAPAIAALAAGGATFAGVWALTGRRAPSDASTFYLTEGEQTTGGANIVNTILVDFRALDTLGELTVLGVAGLVVATLLTSRRPTPSRPSTTNPRSPIADPRENTVFIRTVGRVVGPLTVLLSIVLLLRGHQEPGGGFIAALMGGSGFALLYLAARSDESARIRWPYLVLTGAGVAVGAATGLVGYVDGSFLAPLHVDILGYRLTSALVFDIGVYLAVIGLVLASFNLLGRPRTAPAPDRSEPPAPEPDEPAHEPRQPASKEGAR